MTLDFKINDQVLDEKFRINFINIDQFYQYYD